PPPPNCTLREIQKNLAPLKKTRAGLRPAQQINPLRHSVPTPHATNWCTFADYRPEPSRPVATFLHPCAQQALCLWRRRKCDKRLECPRPEGAEMGMRPAKNPARKMPRIR
ncbi:hypothetical protein BC937DRAFT_88051, partial [Endogone sp. FLAS-F59071]